MPRGFLRLGRAADPGRCGSGRARLASWPGLLDGRDASSGAGAKRALPRCEAVIVHLPGAAVVTVDPDTVHTGGVSEANDTASPDDADADTVTGTPTSAPGGWLKVIVCGACPAWTWNERA